MHMAGGELLQTAWAILLGLSTEDITIRGHSPLAMKMATLDGLPEILVLSS